MEINNGSVDAHFKLMTNPDKYGLPIRSLSQCFAASVDPTASHELFEAYHPENPNCTKVFFYIVMEMVYGPANVKVGQNFGWNLKFVENLAPESTAPVEGEGDK